MDSQEWACGACTLRNAAGHQTCIICQEPRPPAPPRVFVRVRSRSPEPGGDIGGGGGGGGAAARQDPLKTLCIQAKKGLWRKDQVRDFVNTRGIDLNSLQANKRGERRTPLAYAVMYNNDDFARFLMRLEPAAADPNFRMPPTEDCPTGETALTLAAKNAEYDGTDMVRLLLAHGADEAQLTEVPEEHVNRTMRYWRTRARERRPNHAAMARAFQLEGLREVEFAVVGEQAATTAISTAIQYFMGQHDQQEGKPLVIFIPGAPGHGKTYFTKNLAKALVGEKNLLFLPMGSVKSARQLFGYQWGSGGDDGKITTFLKERQDIFSIVMLDEFEKPESLVNEGGWDQAKPLYQSFLEPWDQGTMENAGEDRAPGGGGNAAASAGGRTIHCHKCIFICTTNLCQDEIVAFAKHPDNQHRMSQRMTEADIQWVDRVLVQKTVKPAILAFLQRISKSMASALLRRIDLIVPFVPLAREEQVVVADMELRRFFADFRKPPQWEDLPNVPMRMAGNLLVTHTEDVAELAADEYSEMEGAMSMKKAAKKFCIPIATGYLQHQWEEAETVEGAVGGSDSKTVPLKRLWLHVKDDESKMVVVATVKPKPKPKPADGGGEHGASEGGGAGAHVPGAAGGAEADEDVDSDFD
jgi:hypothetical protein